MAVPASVLFFTQIGTLVWMLATMRQQHISITQRVERIDKHTQDHCTELQQVNVRLVRLETQLEAHDSAGRDWRKEVGDRFTRLESRLERLENRDDDE